MKSKMIFNITIVGLLLVTILAGCGRTDVYNEGKGIQEMVQEAEENGYNLMSSKGNAPGTGYTEAGLEEVRGESTWVHHDAVYGTVHHDAEYEIIHHDAEYETIHHPATQTREIAYSYCEECGAIELP